MKFMTYNVAGCVGRQNQFDAARIAKVLAKVNADVVSLQEVYEPGSGGEFLARIREMGYATVHFGPAVRDSEGNYGNALMIREGDCLIDELDLSVPGKEPRSAIRARFTHRGEEIEVITTHLGLSPVERSQQINKLAEWIRLPEGRTGRRIVLGDLNEWWRFSSRERMFRQHFGFGPRLRTFPSWLPVFRLDRILVTGIDKSEVRWQRIKIPGVRSASDHLPLQMVWERKVKRSKSLSLSPG